MMRNRTAYNLTATWAVRDKANDKANAFLCSTEPPVLGAGFVHAVEVAGRARGTHADESTPGAAGYAGCTLAKGVRLGGPDVNNEYAYGWSVTELNYTLNYTGTALQCQKACAAATQCTLWAYDAKEYQYGTPACWLATFPAGRTEELWASSAELTGASGTCPPSKPPPPRCGVLVVGLGARSVPRNHAQRQAMHSVARHSPPAT